MQNEAKHQTFAVFYRAPINSPVYKQPSRVGQSPTANPDLQHHQSKHNGAKNTRTFTNMLSSFSYRSPPLVSQVPANAIYVKMCYRADDNGNCISLSNRGDRSGTIRTPIAALSRVWLRVHRW